MTKIIGKVSATEKNPSTCDDFSFWLTDDTILSPFDIVRVHNTTDNSETYGVVQDILHITDSPSHISNYISSDFGDAQAKPMTKKLGLSFAKCSVIHNTNENFMPSKYALFSVLLPNKIEEYIIAIIGIMNFIILGLKLKK